MNREQRGFARLAGGLFLGVLLLALGGGLGMVRVAGDGDFASIAARVAASETSYRMLLSSAVLVTLCGVLLAFALYQVLRPIDAARALLGLLFSLVDSAVALVVRTCGFVRLHLYLVAAGGGKEAAGAAALDDLARTTAATLENIGGIAFGIGSGIFFWLFWRSGFFPRGIAGLGVFASMLWVVGYFGGLVFPERHGLLQMASFGPMLLAEVITGFWLLFAKGGKGASLANAAG